MALLLFLAALPIVALTKREETHDVNQVMPVMLVQKRMDLQPTGPRVSCSETLTEQQQARPVEDVVAESGEDGFCALGSLGEDVRLCAASREERNVSGFVEYFKGMFKSVLDTPQPTPFTFILPNGGRLVTRDHSYPYDDVFCLVNEFYQIPRHLLVSNFSFLEEVSEKSCKDVETVVPNYHNLSINDLNDGTRSNNKMLAQMEHSKSGIAYLDQSVIQAAYKQLAVNCLMRGGGRGAVCNVANCAARGCMRPDGVMLYSSRGECIDA